MLRVLKNDVILLQMIARYMGNIIFCDISGEFCQEIQSDISVLPPTEAYPAVLFIYSLLHYSSSEYVHARSPITSLDSLLYPWNNVCLEYPSSTTVIPVHCALPSV